MAPTIPDGYRACVIAVPEQRNCRDLGGLRRAGGTTRAGRLVRTATPRGVSAEERRRALGFARIVDLRTEQECLDRPHPLADLPGYRHRPLIDPAAETRWDAAGQPTTGHVYCGSVDHNTATLRAVFATIAEGAATGGPVLVGCRAGKDRTGMVVAILLEIAGVDRDDVAADYARTPDEPPTDPADIRRMLEHLDARHGGAAAYVRSLGVATGPLETLL